MKHTLKLRAETLTELAETDLENVVGGTRLTLGCTERCNLPTFPLDYCFSD